MCMCLVCICSIFILSWIRAPYFFSFLLSLFQPRLLLIHGYPHHSTLFGALLGTAGGFNLKREDETEFVCAKIDPQQIIRDNKNKFILYTEVWYKLAS